MLFALVLLLTACAGQLPEAKNGIVFTDESGVQVVLPENPKRTAVLLSSFADIWQTAGGDAQITVYESVERGFAAQDAVLVDAGAGKTIDTELLLAQKPDLVIGSADIPAQKDAVELCRSAGIPAVVLRVESFEEYLQALELFTRLTGQSELYEEHGKAVQEKIGQMIARYSALQTEQKILFIRAGSTARSTKAKGSKDHFACAMLKELGTVNIADSAPVLLDGLSFEEVLMQDPDFIFVTTMGDEQAAKAYMDALLREPTWQSLTAVKDGRIAYLPKDLFQYKPNARWDEAYAWLIALLQGEEPAYGG